MASFRRKPPPVPLDETGLRDIALAYAGRYATTRRKLSLYLARKLRERGWAGDAAVDIEALVEEFARLRYVDDAAYAEMKAGSLTRRGMGVRRIRQALKQDGVAQADGATALEQSRAQAWEAARRLAQRRRIGPYAPSPAEDRALREKQLAMFLRAGHDMETARQWVMAAPGEMPEKPC